MAHLAKIDNNNIVIDVVKIPDEQEHRGQEYMHEIGFPGRYIQTSYNTKGNVHAFGGTPLRGNYASIGGVYDPELDVFYSKQPNEDMILNTTTFLWEYPVPYPDNLTETQIAVWNRETKGWDIKDISDMFVRRAYNAGI